MFQIDPDVQNRIYEQFDQAFTIVPHYPHYVYIQIVTENSWGQKSRFKRWQAEMIYEAWKASRKEIAHLWIKKH